MRRMTLIAAGKKLILGSLTIANSVVIIFVPFFMHKTIPIVYELAETQEASLKPSLFAGHDEALIFGPTGCGTGRLL